MPRVSYDADTKAAIQKAAVTAREEGKTWKDAHEAAAAVGYKGSLQGIIKLMRTGDKPKGKPGRKPGKAVAKPKGKPGRKPGRPKGATNKAKKTAVAAKVGGDIGSLIDSLVQSRINEALDRAISVLQGAKK